MSKPLNKKPMGELLLSHLLAGNSITNVKAQALWRCRALPKRISELRQQGYPIKAEWRKDSTGQPYKHYQIEES